MTAADPPPQTAQDAISPKVVIARRVLKQLNFDAERSNERSALVLLALLGLTPDTPWQEATNPTLRTVQLMERIRDSYRISANDPGASSDSRTATLRAASPRIPQ